MEQFIFIMFYFMFFHYSIILSTEMFLAVVIENEDFFSSAFHLFSFCSPGTGRTLVDYLSLRCCFFANLLLLLLANTSHIIMHSKHHLFSQLKQQKTGKNFNLKRLFLSPLNPESGESLPYPVMMCFRCNKWLLHLEEELYIF